MGWQISLICGNFFNLLFFGPGLGRRERWGVGGVLEGQIDTENGTWGGGVLLAVARKLQLCFPSRCHELTHVSTSVALIMGLLYSRMLMRYHTMCMCSRAVYGEV